MGGELIEITLGESKSSKGIRTSSFDNTYHLNDEVRDSFQRTNPSFDFHSKHGTDISFKYKFSNIYSRSTKEAYKSGDLIVVGQHCDEGFIVPKELSIAFSKLYISTPLISLIKEKGGDEYISFLHTWAVPDVPEVVDKQVKYWMEIVEIFGEISETIFAPRKNCPGEPNTAYKHAIEYITERSQKSIVLNRNIKKLTGIVNEKGVYFDDCGYHLWEK